LGDLGACEGRVDIDRVDIGDEAERSARPRGLNDGAALAGMQLEPIDRLDWATGSTCLAPPAPNGSNDCASMA
jgi:hypothetical protein